MLTSGDKFLVCPHKIENIIYTSCFIPYSDFARYWFFAM